MRPGSGRPALRRRAQAPPFEPGPETRGRSRTGSRMTITNARGPASESQQPGSRKGLTLLAMTIGFSMTSLDSTIVTVSLPTMQRDLRMTNEERTLVVNAFLLLLAVSIAAGGRFG